MIVDLMLAAHLHAASVEPARYHRRRARSRPAAARVEQVWPAPEKEPRIEVLIDWKMGLTEATFDQRWEALGLAGAIVKLTAPRSVER